MRTEVSEERVRSVRVILGMVKRASCACASSSVVVWAVSGIFRNGCVHLREVS